MVFPDDGPLGRVRSRHGVAWWSAAAAHLLPAVFGVLSVVVGVLGMAGVIFSATPDEPGAKEVNPIAAGLRFLAIGAGLIALSVWLVRRRMRAEVTVAVYEAGLAICEGGEVRHLRFDQITTTRHYLRGIGTHFLGLEVTAGGVKTFLHADHVRNIRAIERALGAER
jgi:hypothetical protein